MADTRLRRFEWAPVRGVWRHELALFRRYWTSSSFASTVEPTFYLLAFGFGFGSLLGHVAGYRYVDFVGTGVVATAALFTSVFPGMFNTYIRRVYQHSYEAVLAAPVDVHELVAGEASWIAVKSGLFSCVPLLVAMAFGLHPAVGMLAVPIVTILTASGFALFGIWASTVVPSINSFDYVITGVLTPLFLVAGTFFPISGLPGWARTAAHVNPLYHCVELVRHAVFGLHPLADLGHLGALALFAAVMAFLAIRGMRRRLID
ncbi:ABC transporter permease [Actinoallomurus spadix]|uniref:Transport permease protein n=1 Tax=Actinoallomurus spadix TaxID=79912 RepID=A0ABP3GZE4_9ACTN|nr:ABC transporter permease [Actinoallomurus spadix]MCO5986972.1 ABC transporter permease [Actinoallomurus spadix]